MRSILIHFHCESNTGYAIATLERVFFDMACDLVGGDLSRIHFSYPSMARGASSSLPAVFNQYLILDTRSADHKDAVRVRDYVVDHAIDTLFGFDQPVSLPMYRHLRRAGIKHFISYWGAPMSSVFGIAKRTVKRIEVAFRRHGPDHYIFESQGMADTAVFGRGIPNRKVDVIYLGVDSDRFRPCLDDCDYVYEQTGIERSRRIFIFSGHMEARKGVKTIMHAARVLVERGAAPNWHVLLFGNQPGEELWLLNELGDGEARDHVTFGGYRNDLNLIHRGCYAGIIASTGWDSLTMSSMEMQSSGLPLLLSDLPGLNEAIEDDVSGRLFQPGDAEALADAMQWLLDNPIERTRLSVGARERVERHFTVAVQRDRLVKLVGQLTR